MKKLLIIVLVFSFILTACQKPKQNDTTSTIISSDEISSETSSKEISSEISSSVISSEKESSKIESSKPVSSNQTVTSREPRKDGLKSIRLTSGTALQSSYKIDYALTPKELDKFMQLYDKLELEYVGTWDGYDPKTGYGIPGAGSMSPCHVLFEFYDKRKPETISFPEFYGNNNQYKVKSGAKELLQFVSNLDCYKKEKIDLYALWLKENSK